MDPLQPRDSNQGNQLLRPFVDTLIQNDNDIPPIANQLKPYIGNFSKKPPGSHLPKQEWVQLNRLRTGVGRFGATMVKL